MTRLSHVPFAKSFLAISLSAVFSGAVYADVEDIPTNEDFVVTVNGIEQSEAHSESSNPGGYASSWWGSVTESLGNKVHLTAQPSQDGSFTLVAEQTYGGWSLVGPVQNNQVTIEGSEGKKLLLAGTVYGGFSRQVRQAEVSHNEVTISHSTLDGDLILSGGFTSYFRNFETEPLFQINGLSSSVTHNRISISDTDIGFINEIHGGAILEYGGDIARADHNAVIMTNVQGLESEYIAVLLIYGGRVRRALEAHASENYVELTNVFKESGINREDRVFGGSASGWETHANNNVINLTNSSFAKVCVGNANSDTSVDDLTSGAAEASGNRLYWKNTQDTISVPLFSLTVAKAYSDTNATVSSNYAELSGLKTVDIMVDNDIFEDSSLDFLKAPQVMGFFANTDETGDAVANGNVLKITQSHFDLVYGTLVSGKKTETKNNSIVVSGAGDRNSMSMEGFYGFQAIGYEYSELSGNSLFVEDTKSKGILSMHVAGNADIYENYFAVKNTALNSFNGILIQSGSPTDHLNIERNHIRLDNVVWFEIDKESEKLKLKPSVNMVEGHVEGNIAIQDNTFEVSNSRDGSLIDLVGIDLVKRGSNGQIVIKSNTLSVKDSKFDNIIGIELAGKNIDYSQLSLSNNTIILDSVEVVGGVYSIASQSGIRSTLPQSGKLILRGSNTVGSVANFDTFQFDLSTATDEPMLSVGASVNLGKEHTIVVNTAGLSSVSDELNLIKTEGAVTLENVTLQTAGTFATKSMVIGNNDGLGSFNLGLYYDELMSQESVLSDCTLTLSDSQLATVALTRRTSEEALNLLQSAENLSVDAPVKGFASLSGSSNFYELGTGFDLNGRSLTVGGALRMNDNWSGVAFAQYSDANADSTVNGFRGDSDMKTYSAGVALRYQTEMPFYTEGAVVFGQADTDFVGSYTNDAARYNSDRFYTTAQLGIGSDVKLSDSVNLNVYGRYSFTYLDGDKVALNNATRDAFDVDDTMIHALRVGARVKGSVAPNVQWFAGAAFERVLDGDVESMVNDAKLKTETLKGNVGIFEVGATLAPNDLGPWTMDVKAGAYAGDRRGVSGSVSVNYVF